MPANATIYAITIAAVLLVTTILPAEFGMDLTGIRRILGLTAMGERKMAATVASVEGVKSAAIPQAVVAANAAAAIQYATMSALPLRFDEIEIRLAPNAQVEYKALLAEGEFMMYTWDAAGAKVKFDFHGEPSAEPEGALLSFDKGTGSRSGGSHKAPFVGTHGLFWKNTTQNHIVIKLHVSGFYSNIKRA